MSRREANPETAWMSNATTDIRAGIWLTVVGAFVRIALIAASPTDGLVSPDSPSYLDPARAILHHGRFLIDRYSDQYMFVRTPGYPTLVAAAMAIVGDDVKRIALLQAVVSSLLILAAFVFTKSLAGLRVATAVAVCVAFDPMLIHASGQLLTESAHAMALLVIAIVLVAISRHRPQLPSIWFLAGLSLSFATLIRPTTYYLPFLLLIIGVVVLRRRRESLVRAITCLAASIVPVLLLIGGWQVRNELRVDSPRFSGIEAVNMYFYRGGGVISEVESRPFNAVLEELRADYPPLAEGEQQGPYYEHMFDKGRALVRSHPLELIETALRALPRMTLGEGGMFLDFARIPKNLAVIWTLRLGNACVWTLWSLSLVVLVSKRQWRARALALAIPVIYVIAISAGPEAYSRFRTPVMPLVYVMCGVGVHVLRVRWMPRKKRV